MPLVPHRFLFRFAHSCRRLRGNVTPTKDSLFELSADYRVDAFPEMDDAPKFADVFLGWNEHGVALRLEVKGKTQPPQGNLTRPRGSDGITLWLDTRDARANHRATRYCHQFTFLAAGAGDDHDEPAVVQAKIGRALEDAPHGPNANLLVRVRHQAKGYALEAFVPASALNGYDPEQHPRLGFFYALHDEELGDQLLNLTHEFPYWEDPTLWSVLVLQ